LSISDLGSWPGVLNRLLQRESLSAAEAERVLDEILEARATPAQVGAFLVALAAKGETAEETVGLVRGMLAHAEAVTAPQEAIDLVGTGGDRLGSINVTTLAAFIAAGAGACVCKHGNRAASSSVGTADVLEALGVAVELGPRGVERCVREVGMGFCFAPRFHPAMRTVGPLRRELGVPTIFNFLGPLSNPARVRYQLVGVSDPSRAETMARVLGANGSRRAMVVYADDGLDELSVTSPSTVVEVIGDGSGGFDLRRWRVDPAEVGLPVSEMTELRGGDASFNARVIRGVLDGERGACRDIGVLNAAAALVVVGIAEDLVSGIGRAEASLDEGRAYAVLEGLVRVSKEEALSSS